MDGDSKIASVAKLVGLFLGAVALGALGFVGVQYLRIAPERFGGNYDRYFGGSKADLILYTSSTCDVCDDAKLFFSEVSVTFEEREIHQWPMWHKDLEELGFQSVPVLMFRDEAIVGFRASDTQRALKRHGLL